MIGKKGKETLIEKRKGVRDRRAKEDIEMRERGTMMIYSVLFLSSLSLSRFDSISCPDHFFHSHSSFVLFSIFSSSSLPSSSIINLKCSLFFVSLPHYFLVICNQ